MEYHLVREIRKLKHGEETRRRRQKYTKVDLRIERLRDFYELGQMQTIEFLEAIGHALKLD